MKSYIRRIGDNTYALALMNTGEYGQVYRKRADRRFAEHIGDTSAIEVLDKIETSYAPGPIVIAVHDHYCKNVKRRRLAALRHLKKIGKLRHSWDGFWLFGVLTRVSNYWVIEPGPES